MTSHLKFFRFLRKTTPQWFAQHDIQNDIKITFNLVTETLSNDRNEMNYALSFLVNDNFKD